MQSPLLKKLNIVEEKPSLRPESGLYKSETPKYKPMKIETEAETSPKSNPFKKVYTPLNLKSSKTGNSMFSSKVKNETPLSRSNVGVRVKTETI